MKTETAITATTHYADFDDRKIAYRRIGNGPPLILALRFRGVMDSWDPLFLDELAKEFTVITFDYTGLGASTGTATYDRASLAKDAKDLIDYLGFPSVVIGGWSLGGVVAQTFAVTYPSNVSQVVLIGTAPPGPPKFASEPLFVRTAMKPFNDLEDEQVLFFEPDSTRSKESARRSHDRIAKRTEDRSPVIEEATFLRLLSEAKDRSTIYPDPIGRHAEILAAGLHPILAVCGDHDIACPTENWLELNRAWRSLHLITIPQAGHAPHHQEPEFCSAAIRAFVRSHS